MDQNNTHNMQNYAMYEPTVGSCYKHGWHQLWKYFLELLLIAVIGFVIGLPSGWFDLGGDGGNAGTAILAILGFAYTLLLAWPIQYGVYFAHLKAARGDQLKVKDMFEVFKNYLNAVLANILVVVIICIGLILFIVPGIIFGCKLAFVPYLVVDRKMEVIEAVKESWRMTSGYAWKVFFIGLLAIPIAIAGLVCFCVGIIPAIMWISLAFASLYHAVSMSGEASTPTEELLQ